MSFPERRGRKRGRLFRVLAALCACGLSGCAGSERREEPLQRFSFAEAKLGTEFRLLIYAETEDRAAAAAQAAFRRVDELDAILSDYRADSELRRLAARGEGRAPTDWVPVSPDLWAVLSRAREISVWSEGAFDVTVGPVVRLWRRAIRQSELPEPARLASALHAVGYGKLDLDPRTRSVRFRASGMSLDLGGIAKGYVVDEVARLLAARGLSRHLVDGGGDLRVGAAPPGGEAWIVSIDEGPVGPEAASPIHLAVSDCAVATSGDRYRFVEIGGVRYSHLLDPRTGLGLRSAPQVTIVAPDAMTADALASTVSVLGSARGLVLLEGLSGVEGRIREGTGPEDGACQSGGFARMMAEERAGAAVPSQ